VEVLERSSSVIKETHSFDELMQLHEAYCHAQRALEQAQGVVRSSAVSCAARFVCAQLVCSQRQQAKSAQRDDAVNARNATREALVRVGEQLAAASQRVQQLSAAQQRTEHALDSLGSLECAVDANVSEAAIDAALNAHREWKQGVNDALQQVSHAALAHVDRSAAQLIAVATTMQNACHNSAGSH
jgi:hypothetical protein